MFSSSVAARQEQVVIRRCISRRLRVEGGGERARAVRCGQPRRAASGRRTAGAALALAGMGTTTVRTWTGPDQTGPDRLRDELRLC